MKTQTEVREKKAGSMTELVVKGTVLEPRIYPGSKFKPGDNVVVSKFSWKSTAGLTKYLESRWSHIQEYIKEWDSWFEYVYPAHSGRYAMLRRVLFNMSISSKSKHWDTPLLEALYVRDKLDLSKWSKETQIASLVSVLSGRYIQVPVEETKKNLYACAIELDEKGIAVKHFVTEVISQQEPWWLKVEKNPDVDPNTMYMDEALKHSNVDPKEYQRKYQRGLKGAPDSKVRMLISSIILQSLHVPQA